MESTPASDRKGLSGRYRAARGRAGVAERRERQRALLAFVRRARAPARRAHATFGARRNRYADSLPGPATSPRSVRRHARILDKLSCQRTAGGRSLELADGAAPYDTTGRASVSGDQ